MSNDFHLSLNNRKNAHTPSNLYMTEYTCVLFRSRRVVVSLKYFAILYTHTETDVFETARHQNYANKMRNTHSVE